MEAKKPGFLVEKLMASLHPISFILFAAAVVACGPDQQPTPMPPRPTQQIAIFPGTAALPVTAAPTRSDTPVVVRTTPAPPRPTTRATPTRTLTARPTASRIASATLPPTAVATLTLTATATATTASLRYKSANKGCEHSGQTFIQGTVYHGSDRVNGVTVVMSGFPEGVIADKKVTGPPDSDGFYSMVVNAGGSANGQKRWVWIVENSQRASDIVQFDFNNLKAGDAAACWRGFVDFVQQY